MSETLKLILENLNDDEMSKFCKKLDPKFIQFPFDIENVCRDNDAKIQELELKLAEANRHIDDWKSIVEENNRKIKSLEAKLRKAESVVTLVYNTDLQSEINNVWGAANAYVESELQSSGKGANE